MTDSRVTDSRVTDSHVTDSHVTDVPLVLWSLTSSRVQGAGHLLHRVRCCAAIVQVGACRGCRDVGWQMAAMEKLRGSEDGRE